MKLKTNIPWPNHPDRPMWHATGANGRGIYYLHGGRWRVWVRSDDSPALRSRAALVHEVVTRRMVRR